MNQCFFCKEVQLLVNCNDCQEKICRNCYSRFEKKSYSGETIEKYLCSNCVDCKK